MTPPSLAQATVIHELGGEDGEEGRNYFGGEGTQRQDLYFGHVRSSRGMSHLSGDVGRWFKGVQNTEL